MDQREAAEAGSAGIPNAGLGARVPSAASFANIWLLQTVPLNEIEKLARQCREIHFTAGDVVFRQGEASDGLFLVENGTVRIIAHGDNNEQLLASVGQGDCFGEMGVIDG